MNQMFEIGKKLKLFKDNIFDSLLNPESKNTIFAQTIRQGISGGITTIADLVVFQVLVMMDVSIYIAALCSGLLTFGIQFTLTKFYVFKNKSRRAVPGQLMQFIFVFVVFLLILEVCLFVFTSYLAVSPLVAKIMSIPIIFTWTVIANRLIFIKKYDF